MTRLLELTLVLVALSCATQPTRPNHPAEARPLAGDPNMVPMGIPQNVQPHPADQSLEHQPSYRHGVVPWFGRDAGTPETGYPETNVP
jgi:hypothetical protein